MKPGEEWILGDVDEPRRPAKRPQAEQKPQAWPKPQSRTNPERGTRARAKARRRGGTLGRLALFLLWLGCFLAGATGTVLLITGILRDSTYGEGRAPVDLSHSRASTIVEFRPWVPGRYFLYLETLDRTDRESEQRFSGRLEMVVAMPDGTMAVAEPFEPPALDHRLTGGTEWTRLKEFYVVEPSFEPWRATMTVEGGDAAFADARSALLVVRDKQLAGIDGLINYAAAWPAAGAFAFAFFVAVALSRRGGTWIPALLSVLGLGAIGALYSFV